MAGFSAALVDEVTSILFMASLVIHLASRLRVSFFPLLISVVFATVIGSSATVIGNPVGVMIALKAQLGFSDFLRWATPISLVALFTATGICYVYFRHYFQSLSPRIAEYVRVVEGAHPNNGSPQRLDRTALILFISIIALLVSHSEIEKLLCLPKNNVLVAAPILGGSIALFIQREHARGLFEKRVDWGSLAFFLMCFATVGILKYVGAVKVFSQLIFQTVGENVTFAIPFIGFVAGIMSAFMDNILAVAVWIAIVQELAETGLPTFPLWWTLLFAGTLMGNLTLIGSTANIVAVGLAERQGPAHISMKDWIKIGAPVSLATFSLALSLIYLQLPLMLSPR